MPCGKGQWSVPSPGTQRRAIRCSDKLRLATSGLAEVSGNRGFRGFMAACENTHCIQEERCKDGSVSQRAPTGPENGGDHRLRCRPKPGGDPKRRLSESPLHSCAANRLLPAVAVGCWKIARNRPVNCRVRLLENRRCHRRHLPGVFG